MNPNCLLAFSTLLLLPAAYAHVDGGIPGTPKTYCENVTHDVAVHEYAHSVGPLAGVKNVNPDDCDPLTTPHDFDGHSEYALHGAFLLAGAGSSPCFKEDAHHPSFPTVWVEDLVLGTAVHFEVSVDYVNNLPPLDPNEPNCGDLETDHAIDCFRACNVPFPPGLDGAYHVYVDGCMGHVSTDPLGGVTASSDPWAEISL